MARSGRTVARIIGTRRTCRAHHSASPSHVPSNDVPTTRRGRPPALRRPDGRRPGRLGPARARAGSGVFVVELPEPLADAPRSSSPGSASGSSASPTCASTASVRRRGARRAARRVLAALGRRSSTSARRTARSARRVEAIARTRSSATGGRTGRALAQDPRGARRARVWWAPTDAVEEYEDALLDGVRRGVPAGGAGRAARPDVVLPFANLRRATGERKATGLTASLPADPAAADASRRGRRRCRPATPRARRPAAAPAAGGTIRRVRARRRPPRARPAPARGTGSPPRPPARRRPPPTDLGLGRGHRPAPRGARRADDGQAAARSSPGSRPPRSSATSRRTPTTPPPARSSRSSRAGSQRSRRRSGRPVIIEAPGGRDGSRSARP